MTERVLHLFRSGAQADAFALVARLPAGSRAIGPYSALLGSRFDRIEAHYELEGLEMHWYSSAVRCRLTPEGTSNVPED